MTATALQPYLSGCGFNPCFGGSYIVTLSALDKSIIPMLFQSLFWWILYCDSILVM